MCLLRQAFITLFMAVQRSRALSEETSGYIRPSCHRARLHWSALISIKMDMVWDRSEGIGPPCGEMNVLWGAHCDGFTKHRFTLSMFYFPNEFLLLGHSSFPCWITSVITSPLCSCLQMNTETVLSQLSYFHCHVCMMCTFEFYHWVYKEEQRIFGETAHACHG